MTNESNHTAYDDVFRTLLLKCSPLIIPVINEIFNENYTGEEQIIFSPNEHYITLPNGKQEKRITDSSFKIINKASIKHYLCECQSKDDQNILIRIFEYAILSGMQNGTLLNHKLTITIPHCAILFLRCNQNTPDKMSIEIQTPKDSIEFDVHIMKSQSYTIEDLFEKKLLFLISFYIFVYEKELAKYDLDDDKLQDLQAEFYEFVALLDDMVIRHEIDVETKRILLELSKKVINKLAKNFKNVKKGLNKVMGGQILELEVDEIKNKGKQEEKVETAKRLLHLGLSIQDIIIATELDQATIENLLKSKDTL